MSDLTQVLSPAAYNAYRREQIDRLRARTSAKTGGAETGIYRTADGIVRFVRGVLGAEPAPYQEEILRAFVQRRRVAVRAPHGVGKTALSAWIVLWAMAVFEVDVKVVTTASAWRQLEKYTWPEIHKWARHADWSSIGRTVRTGVELLGLSLKFPDKEAFAVASDNPDLIEGAHASLIVYVFDEAKAIPNGTWDAAEGAFSTGEAYALAISTPGEPSGRFYDIHQRKPGYEDWWTRHVTLTEGVCAGRVRQDWVDQRKRQWGEQSAVYQNRVEGEFADTGEDSVIPLRWVELANERWRDCEGKGPEGGAESYGVDPAYKGDDDTAIARLVAQVCEWIESHSKEDTMQTAGRVAGLIGKKTPCAVDTIGVGAGVYDRLHEQGFEGAIAVNVSVATDLRDKDGTRGFKNLRSYVWWALREGLDPDGDAPLALPPDDELTGDLTAPLWRYLSNGNIEVEAKPDIKTRIGRSPDKADALCLAYYAAHYHVPFAMEIGDW